METQFYLFPSNYLPAICKYTRCLVYIRVLELVMTLVLCRFLWFTSSTFCLFVEYDVTCIKTSKDDCRICESEIQSYFSYTLFLFSSLLYIFKDNWNYTKLMSILLIHCFIFIVVVLKRKQFFIFIIEILRSISRRT